MKRIIIALILLCMLFTTATAEYERLSIWFGNVIDLEWDTDCVSIDDGLGSIWEYYGCDQFFYDDLVVMVIDDKGTAEWADDSVIFAMQCTYDEGYEMAVAYRESPEKFFSSFLEKYSITY